jgi:hypothetical protein
MLNARTKLVRMSTRRISSSRPGGSLLKRKQTVLTIITALPLPSRYVVLPVPFTCSISSPWFVSGLVFVQFPVSVFIILQIEDDLKVTIAEAELEVEIEVSEDENSKDVLNYDDSGIGVTCILE